MQIASETSQTRQIQNTAGFNVSYDNSISAVRSNIYHFKGQQDVPIDEKQNKPRDLTADRPGGISQAGMAMEVSLRNVVEDRKITSKSPVPVLASQ